MYNNIGLKTVRGSGTNGYIQTNLAALPANWKRFRGRRRTFEEPTKKRLTKPSKDLINHNKKRAVEVKVFEYRTKLEEEELDQVELEGKVAAFRGFLMEKMNKGEFDEEAKYLGHNANMREKEMTNLEEAVEKEKKNKKFREALGIRQNYEKGAAFDQDLQLKLKNERVKRLEENMTLEEKLARKKETYLDRIGGQEIEAEPLPPRPPISRLPPRRFSRSPSPRPRPLNPRSVRDRPSYKTVRAFSRSASPPRRRLSRSHSPRPSRKRRRTKDVEPREPKKIERWKSREMENISGDESAVEKLTSKKKKKKKKKKKSKGEKKKKKKKKKKKAVEELEEGEELSASA